ncbi:MAG TPA: hypothetical protein VNK43_00025, partial [Gemmatimonadales bacterium]|nr:hypothetical protein [Gemmatimonadales bacterium]
MNDRIRREGTRALTTAAARVGARLYLQQGVAWVVKRPADGPPFDEDTPPDPPVLLRSAVDGERIAREAGVVRRVVAAVVYLHLAAATLHGAAHAALGIDVSGPWDRVFLLATV